MSSVSSNGRQMRSSYVPSPFRQKGSPSYSIGALYRGRHNLFQPVSLEGEDRVSGGVSKDQGLLVIRPLVENQVYVWVSSYCYCRRKHTK